MSPEISCFREPLKAAIWLREQTHSVCYAVFPGRSSGEIRPVNPALWQHCTIPRHTRQLLRLRGGGFFALAARFSFAHFHVQYASGSLYPAYPAARTQAAGGYFRTQQGFRLLPPPGEGGRPQGCQMRFSSPPGALASALLRCPFPANP